MIVHLVHIQTIAYHAIIASYYADCFCILSTYLALHLDQVKKLPLVPVTSPSKKT